MQLAAPLAASTPSPPLLSRPVPPSLLSSLHLPPATYLPITSQSSYTSSKSTSSSAMVQRRGDQPHRRPRREGARARSPPRFPHDAPPPPPGVTAAFNPCRSAAQTRPRSLVATPGALRRPPLPAPSCLPSSCGPQPPPACLRHAASRRRQVLTFLHALRRGPPAPRA